jgi:hypothetical protein
VWPIGLSAGIINNKHICIEDRRECAIKFRDEYKTHFPIFLDNMNSDYENTYSCWPFRYHVIVKKDDDYVLTLVPEPVDSEFDMEELTLHLEKS